MENQNPVLSQDVQELNRLLFNLKLMEKEPEKTVSIFLRYFRNYSVSSTLINDVIQCVDNIIDPEEILEDRYLFKNLLIGIFEDLYLLYESQKTTEADLAWLQNILTDIKNISV